MKDDRAASTKTELVLEIQDARRERAWRVGLGVLRRLKEPCYISLRVDRLAIN